MYLWIQQGPAGKFLSQSFSQSLMQLQQNGRCCQMAEHLVSQSSLGWLLFLWCVSHLGPVYFASLSTRIVQNLSIVRGRAFLLPCSEVPEVTFPHLLSQSSYRCSVVSIMRGAAYTYRAEWSRVDHLQRLSFPGQGPGFMYSSPFVAGKLRKCDFNGIT